jgi:hypothetical protein
MTAGHFGLAAGVKAGAPRIPLWALMLSTYLLDVVFIILVMAGVESFAPMDPSHPTYGQVIIHAYYDHSLVGALVIAIIAGGLARWAWGRGAGLVIGGVTFSHWLLDLIVHHPDLPVLPGNAGGLPLLGFGLWGHPAFSALLELVLVLSGGYLYARAAARAPVVRNGTPHGAAHASWAAAVVGLLMLAILATDYFGWSESAVLVEMLLLIVVGGWLDSRLRWRSEAVPA